MTTPIHEDPSRWDVWRVHYMTYAEVLTMGDKRRERVGHKLGFEQARRMVAEMGSLGTGRYSMHPSDGGRPIR